MLDSALHNSGDVIPDLLLGNDVLALPSTGLIVNRNSTHPKKGDPISDPLLGNPSTTERSTIEVSSSIFSSLERELTRNRSVGLSISLPRDLGQTTFVKPLEAQAFSQDNGGSRKGLTNAEKTQRSRLPSWVGLARSAKTADLAIAEKVSSTLASLDSTARSQPANPLLQISDDGVLINAVAAGEADALLSDLNAIGLQNASAFGSLVSGWLPITAIGEMAALETLHFARPAYRPIASIGSTTSQADVATNAEQTRSNFNVDGSGITVGVISDSYDTSTQISGSAEADILSGDLPGLGNPFGNTTPINVLQDFRGNTIDEGRAMLQLVHDLAPGADLAFHTAIGGEARFANGILALANTAAADVIVDDIIYLTEPMFQDGLIAQAVDQVVEQGVAYFSAAGNAGRNSYEAEFRPGIDDSANSGYRFHDFDPGAGIDISQRFSLGAGEAIQLSFQWDEPFASAGGAGARNDLDIFIVDPRSGQLVASSTENNIGGDAVEILFFENSSGTVTEFDLLIGRYVPVGGPDPGRIKYIDFAGQADNFEHATNSSTLFGHANATGAEAVGAAFYQDTPAFGVNRPRLEPFSSVGGTPLLFDRAGNRLASPQTRRKPEIVAPDGTNTTFFFPTTDVEGDGVPNFFGTSAAAPHAAATAALMLEAAPQASPETIYQTLENTALDMDDPATSGFDDGFDHASGYGLIQADQAIAALSNTDAIAEFGTLTLDETPQTITLNNSYDHPVVFAQPLSFNGRDPAMMRLSNITTNSFTAQIQEANYLDGNHTLESVSYFVLEAGTWQLEDGTLLEVGTLNTDLLAVEGFETVNFTNDFDQTPAIFSQVQTFNGGDFVRTRQRNASADSFQVTMEEEETLENSGHVTERVGYLAMETGTGTWSGNPYQVGTTPDQFTEAFSRINFDPLFGQAPQLLAGLGTYNGNDPSGLRYQNLGATGVEVKVEEDQSKDSEVSHVPEQVNFLALEGSGLLSASSYNPLIA